MGPIALFDKSFLQSLNMDEAVWFDNFFYPVVAPLFIAETLGDLYKPSNDDKTPEEKVARLSEKTPQLGGGPCVFHETLWVADLLGNHVPMNGQIPLAGIRHVQRDGRTAGVAEVSEEARAFAGWQRGQFSAIDYAFGRAWRSSVEATDLGIIERTMKQFGVNAQRCKTLGDAVAFANSAMLGLTKSADRMRAVLALLQVPDRASALALERWKRSGRPTLPVFAPYCAFVVKLELFFRIALGANLIASTRPSHRVDIAYLFYLPFCSVFISSDNLHRACAPYFLRQDQQFVWGPTLKDDLKNLNAHFHALDANTKQQGIYKFASRLPDGWTGVTRDLYEKYSPHLLNAATKLDPDAMKSPTLKKLVDDVNAWDNADPTVVDERGAREVDSLVIKRLVSRKRGSWLQIGPEVPDNAE